MTKKMQERLLLVIASVALALTYIAIGFALCAGFPLATSLSSMNQSAFEASPYTHDDLVELAVETRDYTVENARRSDDGTEGAQEAFANEVLQAAQSSSTDPSKKAEWSEEAKGVLGSWQDGHTDALSTMEALYEMNPSYALNADALSHLDDVNDVISRFRMPLFGCALIAAFSLMSLVMLSNARAAGRALLVGGCIAVGIFCLIGIWGVIGFNSLFTWIHGLFFVDGTWTFPAQSLLIQMYPEGFWISMGLWWLVSSCVVAAASIVIGLVITRRRAPKDEPRQPAGLQA